jgi:hypothetical protein
VKNPLVLTLSDLQIPSPHWRTIWATLPSFPPIRCLRELDWSGNGLPAANVDQFVEYFFQSPIHFLGLDRIYRAGSAQDLTQLIVQLSDSKLWGLSVRGSRECNFSGSFKLLLQALGVLPSLNILHLDGQRMSDDDVPDVLDFLERYRETLFEFSCDESLLSTIDSFYAFYRKIDELDLAAVGRPHVDLVRLFHQPSSSMPPAFEAFRASLQKRHLATSQSIRSFYMCRRNPKGAFKGEDMYQISSLFPAYATIDRRDIWFLYPKATREVLPSLCMLLCPKVHFRSLASLHKLLLKPPLALPRFPPSPDIAVIDTFAEESAQHFRTVFNLDLLDRGEDDPLRRTLSWLPGGGSRALRQRERKEDEEPQVAAATARTTEEDDRSSSWGAIEDEAIGHVGDLPRVLPVRRVTSQIPDVHEEDQHRSLFSVQLKTADGSVSVVVPSPPPALPQEPEEEEEGEKLPFRTGSGPVSLIVPNPPDNIPEDPEEEDDGEKLTFRTGFGSVSLAVPDPPPGVPDEPEEEDQGDELKFKTEAGAISVKVPETPIGVPGEPDDEEEDDHVHELKFKTAGVPVSLKIPATPINVPDEPEEEDHGGALRFKTAGGAVSLIIPRTPEDLPEEPDEEEDVAQALKFRTRDGTVSLIIPSAPEDLPEEPEDLPDELPEDLPEEPAEDLPEEPPEDLPEEPGDDLPEEPRDDLPENPAEDLPEEPEEEEEEPFAPPVEEEYYRWSPATWAPPPAPGEPPRPLRLDPARRRRAPLARVVGSLALIHLEFGAEHRRAAGRTLNSLDEKYDIPQPTNVLPWTPINWFTPLRPHEIENVEFIQGGEPEDRPCVKGIASTAVEQVDEFYGHRPPFIVHKPAPIPTPGIMHHPKEDRQKSPTKIFLHCPSRSVDGSFIK